MILNKLCILIFLATSIFPCKGMSFTALYNVATFAGITSNFIKQQSKYFGEIFFSTKGSGANLLLGMASGLAFGGILRFIENYYKDPADWDPENTKLRWFGGRQALGIVSDLIIFNSLIKKENKNLLSFSALMLASAVSREVGAYAIEYNYADE